MALGEFDLKRIAEIREEVRRFGVEELLTAEEVEAARPEEGTCLLFVNTHDECAADLARPALAVALQHDRIPAKVYSVFAGQELDATARARAYFKDTFPTAPQIGLVVDGRLAYMCDRDDMQKRLRNPDKIADELTAAFDEHCPEAD